MRHIRRCTACRAFHERSLVLAERMVDESLAVACEVRPELHARLLELSRPGGAGTSPAVPGKRSVLRLRSRLIPAAAAAVVLFAFVAAYLYQTPPVPPPEDNALIWGLVDPVGLAADHTSTITATVEGPIEEEIRLLKEDGIAAADFILACLPIDVETPWRTDSP